MVKDIDYYRKISGSYDTASKQECQRNSLASKFTNDFSGSIAYETVLVNGVSKGVIIQKAGIQNNIREIHKITMKPGDSISVGDMVNWNNVDWLCVQADNVHGIYEYGNIQQCKHELKYYGIDHTLYTKSCVVYSGNEDEDISKYMTLASDERILHCRNETDTAHINSNTRFILSGEPYKVIGTPNRLTKVGLLEIKVKMDSITVNDNVDLGIADYGLNQIIKSIVIKNSNTATMLYTNTTLQLIVECRNNGVVVSNPVVTYISNAVNVATVSVGGIITAIGTGTAIITATYGGISATITVNSVMSLVDDYNVVISPVDVSIVFGKSKTFTTTILNNGVIQTNKSCVWTLVNSDGTTTPYATLVSNGLSCTVTASNKSVLVGKYIRLRSAFAEDLNVYTEREIKIIGLL